VVALELMPLGWISVAAPGHASGGGRAKYKSHGKILSQYDFTITRLAFPLAA
jgi:hypothetical protein